MFVKRTGSLTIVSAVTLSLSSAQCFWKSGWQPRPPCRPPSSDTGAETRRSRPSETLWDVWMTGPTNRHLVILQHYCGCTNLMFTNCYPANYFSISCINGLVSFVYYYYYYFFTLSSSRPERIAVSGVTPSSSSSAVPSMDLFSSFTNALKRNTTITNFTVISRLSTCFLPVWKS